MGQDQEVDILRQSGFFDESWYTQAYQDVSRSGVAPLEHYLVDGAVVARDPSPFFDAREYLKANPGLQDSGTNPLWHFVQNGVWGQDNAERFSKKPTEIWLRDMVGRPARKHEAQLWGGFSEDMLEALRAKILIPSQSPSERAYAAWALARWYAFKKDYTRALKYLQQRRFIDPSVRGVKGQILLEADCLNRLGREIDAYELLEERLGKVGYDADLLMAQSNTFCAGGDDPSGEERLALINRIYRASSFGVIGKQVSDQPLSLFNIICVPDDLPAVSSGPRVSVIMPAFNAAGQIELPLRSLLRQSWRNLEILVADDCSTDNTREVVRALAAEDPRIVLLPLAENGGAYAARNAALARASGDFITVHDSDDWSHAQKIEVQVKHLLAHEHLIANLTDWARAREDLYFTGTFRAHGSLISENTSSLMFRREAVDTLGGWDLARTSADSEYVMRLRACYGAEAVERLHRNVPLAFALDQETSLTRTPATHAKTLFYGARREYREAAQAWHAQAAPGELKVPLDDPRRPFPIPQVMQVKRSAEPRRYDLVVISDFNLSGGAYISTMNYVNAALSLGRKVALFHWRRADLDVRAPLRPELRQRAMAGDFDILTAGDPVVAELVLVGYPVVLNHKLDALPDIKTERFAILVNQMASRLITGEDPQYEPERIDRHVRELFGVAPVWVPISGYVQRLMWEDIRYPVPHEDVWNPLLDVDHWCDYRVSWRGAERSAPVVGRHARDHYTKWPASREALEAAYCAERECEVRLLGGADYAMDLLGYRPDNWTVLEYADSTHEFLQELDFFVHYPQEQYIEEFGRAVLEAMGLGIPVILPPVFEETFGDYALYAEPHEVWPLIQRLWRDREAYERAGEHALGFVREKAAYGVLAGRLERLSNGH